MPTSTVSPCSITRGMMSLINCLFVNICLDSSDKAIPSPFSFNLRNL